MENRENVYDRTPFYMTYPMQNLYLAEMEYEKDLERMRELYPREIQPILRLVEQRCDELEREGSRMYDENPDRFMLEEEACRLYERFIQENPQYASGIPEQRPTPQPGMRPMPQPGMPPMPQPGMPPMPQPGMPPRPQPRRYAILPPEELRDVILEPSPQPMPRPMPQQGMRMQEYQEEDLEAQNRRRCDNPWLCNLIHVIFDNEIYRRRCRNRRCRRWQM